jgi:acyl carrier protein
MTATSSFWVAVITRSKFAVSGSSWAKSKAVLKKQSGVQDAVVVAREDQPGDKRLVGYVATGAKVAQAADPSTQHPALVQELIAALRKHLPSYMVPSAFVVLEKLPQTPNGKVDRKRLPVPDYDRSTTNAPAAAPRTATESAVLAIWQEVLRTSPIGIIDNFFDLGGNSLLAIQVISRLRDQFQIGLSLTLLFEAPTIEALATGIDAGKWREQGAATAVPPLVKVPRNGPSPVSFVQERLWFLDQLQPGRDADHIPAAFRFRGPLDPGRLQKALDLIVRRHEALRTTFTFQDGALMQVVAPEHNVQIELLRLSTNESEEPEQWLEAKTRELIARPFDLFTGPLIEARLLSVNENDHVFIVVMHHSVSDGWSLDILYKELRANYEALEKNLPTAELPELPVQYPDFAVWKRRSLEGPLLNNDLDYWKQKLTGAPALTDLPADFSPTETGDPKAGAETVDFDARSMQHLQTICRRDSVTPFMVLLASLAISLRKWTGQEDLVIGTVVAGRVRREIENLIGCFINFLPLRVAAPASISALEILSQVRASVAEGQDHQTCPFERIVEAINPERKLNQNPLYNVGLLLQDHTEHYFTAGDLRSEPYPAYLDSALLDLRLEAVQRGPELSLRCEYRRDLFAASSIKAFVEVFQKCLEIIATSPATPINDFPEVRSAGAASAATTTIAPVAQNFAISSTFTAEPLAEPLKHWAKELGLKPRIEFAPYNQVFQQLLDPSSLLARNKQGLNVILVRVDDWGKCAPRTAIRR